MKPLIQHKGKAAFLDRVNVDTDQIIPKQFLKRIERSGYGQFLFYDWRFHADGSQNTDFELNQVKYQGASILVARNNFGCGSSREHAAWALEDHGFRVIIAPSFADIFNNNCYKNGVLPIVLPANCVDYLFEQKDKESYTLTVDLEHQTIEDDEGVEFAFLVDPYRKHLLLKGLDDIGVTLEHEVEIGAFEARRETFVSA